MKKIYSVKMTNTGGRAGEVFSDDHSLDLKIAAPGSKQAGATNPEQLFAAGYSACFNSALELVTVSYTHLDVYKRQVQMLSEVDAK